MAQKLCSTPSYFTPKPEAVVKVKDREETGRKYLARHHSHAVVAFRAAMTKKAAGRKDFGKERFILVSQRSAHRSEKGT